MKRFKDGKARYLVATDIATRGIDFYNVTCVFNYDMPKNPRNYALRTNCASIYGRIGIAINFIT